MFRHCIFFLVIFVSSSVAAQVKQQGEYKTSDGRTFLDAQQAKSHQNSIDADQLQKSILGNSEKAALEKQKQKEKLASNAASDANFKRQQRDRISEAASEEYQKVKSNATTNPANVKIISSLYQDYNSRDEYIKGLVVLSVASPARLPYDFRELVGNGSLFSSDLTETERRRIITLVLKNTESTQMFGGGDDGVERVFNKYCTDSTSFGDEMLPKLMTYIKRRSQDYIYKSSAHKMKSPAAIKWLKDNGVSREYDAFRELKENVKKILQVNQATPDYGKEKPKSALEQISKSGYQVGSDPEMELLRGLALSRIFKFRESGQALAAGWSYYKEHSATLSLNYPITGMSTLPFDAKFKEAAEASMVYLRLFPEWNTLGAYTSMLILDGQQEKAESEFNSWSLAVKTKGIKAPGLGSQKGTEKLMEACTHFYNKRYKKAYKIFKDNEWIERDNRYYWILYAISAKSIGEKAPYLIVDATECTKPEWIDQATWDLGKKD